jgi:hypothetical protein
VSDWRTRERGWYWVKPRAKLRGLTPFYRGCYIAMWDGGSWIIPGDHVDASGINSHTDGTFTVVSQRLPEPEDS